MVVTAAALVGLAPACSEERPQSEEANSATESSGTESGAETVPAAPGTEIEEGASASGTATETGAGAEPPVDPSLLPVDGERPEAAVARCEETAEPDTCVMLALDEAPGLRARERERLIEAHRALGNEARMLDHMEAFLEDYPRDRRGNRFRLRLREAGRP